MAWQSHFKKHDTAPRIYFERQFVARSCADIGITPSHSTVIHHKRASRYVVLGEISHSPFTTYIFTAPRCFLYVFRESGHHSGYHCGNYCSCGRIRKSGGHQKSGASSATSSMAAETFWQGKALKVCAFRAFVSRWQKRCTERGAHGTVTK